MESISVNDALRILIGGFLLGILMTAAFLYDLPNAGGIQKGREQILNQEYVCKRVSTLKDGKVGWECKSVQEIKEALDYVRKVETL